MSGKSFGKTISGRPITGDLIDELVARAEEGYPVEGVGGSSWAEHAAERAIPETVSPGGGSPRRSGGTIWAGIVMPKPDAAELTTFLGPVADRDAEVIEHWREAPAEDHAQAMIELSRYAERMAVQTGIGKDPAERFPGIPEPGSRAQQAA